MVEALRASIAKATAERRCAIVLSSSNPAVFSAGLDIMQMREPSRESFFRYFGAVQSLFFELYLHPSPVISAIRGAAPAGGCWLASLSDYRIMAESPKPQIGLNEVRLGIVAPSYVAEPVIATLHSRRIGEQLLQRGSLVSPVEALRVGLIDECVPGDEVLPRAAAVAGELLALPFEARARTKIQLRSRLAGQVRAGLAEEMEAMWASVSSPAAQAGLKAYLASLARR